MELTKLKLKAVKFKFGHGLCLYNYSYSIVKIIYVRDHFKERLILKKMINSC